MFQVPHDVSGGPNALAETFDRFVPDTSIVHYGGATSFRWSGRLAAANGRSLWRVSSNNDWSFCTQSDHRPFVAVAIPEAGGLTMTEPGRECTTGPGQALILHIPASRRMDAVYRDGHARTTLKWSVAEAERALSSINDDVRISDLEQCPVVDLERDRGLILAGLLSAIAIDIANPAAISPLTSELMHEAALKLIFEPVLEALRARDSRTGNRAVPRQVKLAIEFMHAHAGEAIRIRDVADACRVSPRSLELGFRAFNGMTPVAFLRQLRLEAVRLELENAEQPVRIAEIAKRWGFSDPGRFAERYRRAFGELPSQTRRKR